MLRVFAGYCHFDANHDQRICVLLREERCMKAEQQVIFVFVGVKERVH